MLSPVTVNVPTLNDNHWDFDRLFQMWDQVNADDLDVSFDFTKCQFLRQNAVAFLGGLARLVAYHGGRVTFRWETLRDNIRTNLGQQGFQAAFTQAGGPWHGNSIPYREHAAPHKAPIMHYLKTFWLGRGWVNVSDQLRDAIVGRVWEIYENAFEHSQTPIGVFSCGQHFPQRKELNLTLVDFGVGIPSNVRLFLRRPEITAASALEWSFQLGTSIKPNGIGRGMGLPLLKDFIRKNRGKLEVFSHDGYGRIDHSGEHYQPTSRWFEGTLVNIGLVCDDSYYCLASEAAGGPLF